MNREEKQYCRDCKHYINNVMLFNQCGKVIEVDNRESHILGKYEVEIKGKTDMNKNFDCEHFEKFEKELSVCDNCKHEVSDKSKCCDRYYCKD